MTLTYKDAGVDIAAADAFVDGIKALAKSTHGDRVVPGTSAYAGLLRLPIAGLASPALAASCDGVGTKLMVAQAVGWYEGLGQDLVAMNVNDLLPLGARPLLFLDYIVTGKLDAAVLTEVLRGVAAACRESDCVLLGGETAEHPGHMEAGDFDLAGFAVGLVDESRVPKANAMKVGDVVLALPSSGVHSNGLSLARKALLDVGGLDYGATPDGLATPVGRALLEPTCLYVRPILALMDRVPIRGGAHVTGGGLHGRAEKLLPTGCGLRLDETSFPRPAIFDVIRTAGNIAMEEMYRTFNMGLGYLVVVAPADVATAVATLPELLRVGEITAGNGVTIDE